MLLSQSGPGAVAWLSAMPTHSAVQISSLRMQVALRWRIRWPLPLECSRCNGKACRAKLDALGDHWASCNCSGRLLRRSKPLERVRARVYREAKARVVENAFLRDTALPGIGTDDGRRLEIVATGLPMYKGVSLGVDVTLVSPLHVDGSIWAGAAANSGVAIARAERDKDTTYLELVDSSVLRLVALACETGGRWNAITATVLRDLANACARTRRAWMLHQPQVHLHRACQHGQHAVQDGLSPISSCRPSTRLHRACGTPLLA